MFTLGLRVCILMNSKFSNLTITIYIVVFKPENPEEILLVRRDCNLEKAFREVSSHYDPPFPETSYYIDQGLQQIRSLIDLLIYRSFLEFRRTVTTILNSACVVKKCVKYHRLL